MTDPSTTTAIALLAAMAGYLIGWVCGWLIGMWIVRGERR